MKLLKDDVLQILTDKSGIYDQVVSGLRDLGFEGDVTSETILSIIKDNSSAGLKIEIALLQSNIDQLQSENSNLKTKIDALNALPAEDPASVNHNSDIVSSDEDDIAIYADNHAGDIVQIASEMKKRNLI